MSENDRVLLDAVLADRRASVAPEMSEAEFFEFFLAEQVLIDKDLSWEELQAGLVGGGDDGGIDAVYVFKNGQLLQDGVEHRTSSVEYELYVFQAKRSPGFEEHPVEKLGITLRRALDLSLAEGEALANMNE